MTCAGANSSERDRAATSMYLLGVAELQIAKATKKPADRKTLLLQSEPALQAEPAPQRLQAVAPPQSTSVSPPFWTRSLQEGGWQTAAVQTPLWQSAARLQASPSAQSGQEPPQSTSVSLPFWTKSLQLGV